MKMLFWEIFGRWSIDTWESPDCGGIIIEFFHRKSPFHRWKSVARLPIRDGGKYMKDHGIHYILFHHDNWR